MRSSKLALKILTGVAIASALALLFCVYQISKSAKQIFYSNPYDAVQPFMEGIFTADKTIDAPKDYKIRAELVYRKTKFWAGCLP